MAITSGLIECVRIVGTRGLAVGASGQERVRLHAHCHQTGADRPCCQPPYCLPVSLQTRLTIAHRPTPRSGSTCIRRFETLAVSREPSHRKLFEIPSLRISYICWSSYTSDSTQLDFAVQRSLSGESANKRAFSLPTSKVVGSITPSLLWRKPRCRTFVQLPTIVNAIRASPARSLFRSPRSIDWALVSGPVEATLGKVHATVNTSDHYPNSFTLRFS
jgi:hypothetical protein